MRERDMLAAGLALGAAVTGPAAAVAQSVAAPSPEAGRTRVLPLQGQSNFRDLGGYATADGRQVKWGEVYRSGELSSLTPADYERLQQLHIRTVCDLRNAQERARRPTRWTATPVQTFVSPKPATDPVAHALMSGPDQSPAGVRQAMIAYYRQLPDVFAPEYRVIFQHLIAGDTPLLLHCTAGKDRTGVAAALILLALGVPRATVVQDYVLTGTLMRADRLPDVPGVPHDVLAVLYRADPAYIEAAVDGVQARYGSVDAYLDRALGVGPADRLALRARLLEPRTS